MTPRATAGDGASLTDPPITRYTGRRIGADTEVLRHAADGSTSPLPWRLDLLDHSPTGLQWGDGGSGPAQLALALLADAAGPRKALDAYHDFKREVIARIRQDSWEITREQIQDWIRQQQQDRGR